MFPDYVGININILNAKITLGHLKNEKGKEAEEVQVLF